MELTIIGTGNMARGIGTRAVAAGHNVTLLGTEEGKAQELAEELAAAAPKARVVRRSTRPSRAPSPGAARSAGSR